MYWKTNKKTAKMRFYIFYNRNGVKRRRINRDGVKRRRMAVLSRFELHQT